MMKMSGRNPSCYVALVLALCSVSAASKILNSFKDLKKIDFEDSVPKHSLVLLHWFANTVSIDNNNRIWLTFDPDDGDYGSHHYGNYEGLLDPAPAGYQYYTVGNLDQDTSVQLPDYVVDPPEEEYEGENRDRIIIRVWGQEIDEVYLTQHYDTYEHQGSPYDPAHTYQINTNILRQIRQFSVRQNQRPLVHLRHRYGHNIDDYQFADIKNTWGHLACLGLLLLIVIEEKYSSNQRNHRPVNNSRPVINSRPVNNSRPVINSRPVNNSRPVINSRPVNNSRPENKESHCCPKASDICIGIAFLILFVLFFAQMNRIKSY